MDFSFTEEQEMLRDQAREWLARYDTDRIAELAESDEGWDASSWSELAELGWTGVSIPEEQGGVGLGFVEQAVILEELGRALYPGPFASTMNALPALEGERLEQVAAGEARWSLSLNGDGLVPDLAAVDHVAVADEEGIWAVTGFEVEALPTMDTTRRLGRLSGGERELLVGAVDAPLVVAQMRMHAQGSNAVEAVGIAQKVMELSVEYASTREQFGRPLGVYQAVSHPLADTYIETELSRSLAYWAAWSIAESDEQAPVAAAAAKAYATESAVLACERAIQIHGGIGFTWEHVLHRYYKRAQWLAAYGGFPAVYRRAIARSLLAPAAALA